MCSIRVVATRASLVKSAMPRSLCSQCGIYHINGTDPLFTVQPHEGDLVVPIVVDPRVIMVAPARSIDAARLLGLVLRQAPEASPSSCIEPPAELPLSSCSLQASRRWLTSCVILQPPLRHRRLFQGPRGLKSKRLYQRCK